MGCLLDGNTVSKVPSMEIPNKDKIAHFTFYFVFSIVWFNYIVKSKPNYSKIKLTIYIFTIASATGGVVEILQYFFSPTRSAEWGDVFANCLGSLFGLLLCLTLITKKK